LSQSNEILLCFSLSRQQFLEAKYQARKYCKFHPLKENMEALDEVRLKGVLDRSLLPARQDVPDLLFVIGVDSQLFLTRSILFPSVPEQDT
jgi:hypothetical protein